MIDSLAENLEFDDLADREAGEDDESPQIFS
jgi:hypothetical protein